MANDPRPIDCAGYGAIYALHGTLLSNLESIVVMVSRHERVDIRPFLAVADGMIDTMYSLQFGEDWWNARTQFLVLLHCYHDLIQSLTIADPEAFRKAAAELSEAQTVAVVALYRLADRLGLVPLKARTARAWRGQNPDN